MKKIIAANLIILFISNVAICATKPLDESNVVAQTTIVERQAIEHLGIDLLAIGLLLEVGRDDSSYLDKRSLRHGRGLALETLKEKELIQMEVVKGLPDGTESTQEFVRMHLTKKGLLMVETIEKLQE